MQVTGRGGLGAMKVGVGVCVRRVGHISGAQDMRMGARMCKRGPGRVGRMCGWGLAMHEGVCAVRVCVP